MELVIDPEFADKIPPLTEEEYRLLEENILADGKIISPLITWNGIIVDGHNRYRILQAHPEIPYETMEMEFSDRYAVIVWICRNQLGRRNLTDEQKKFLTGKRYEAEKKQNQWRGNQYVSPDDEESGSGEKRQSQNAKTTSERIAKEIGKGERYVRDAEIYANGVEAANEVAPGIKNEILSGKLKCKDKDVMAIARAAPEHREDLVRKLQFPSARAAPGPPAISSPEEEDEDGQDEVSDGVPAASTEDTIEDVMYELNDALESMIFRWNFCFETHDAIYRQKANQKRIRLLAKEGINYFETILVAGKMRVVIESFENWYARQVKYHKVAGEAPGEILKQESYSAGDIAEILGISEDYVYQLMKAGGVKPIVVNYWQRFPKEAFDQWYASQSRYRNADDRLRDAELEENSMSMPDMARLLDVPRTNVYSILNSDLGKEMLEVIVVADRKRITKESFERWYASQTKYLKPEDQPEGVPRRHKTYADSLVKKKVRTNKGTKEVRYSDNPDYLTVDEAALQAKTSTARVYKWISAGRFPVLRISKMVTRIPRKEFEAFLEENINRK